MIKMNFWKGLQIWGTQLMLGRYVAYIKRLYRVCIGHIYRMYILYIYIFVFCIYLLSLLIVVTLYIGAVLLTIYTYYAFNIYIVVTRCLEAIFTKEDQRRCREIFTSKGRNHHWSINDVISEEILSCYIWKEHFHIVQRCKAIQPAKPYECHDGVEEVL